ncbi:hypothetical protein IR116_09530, partial [Streptococcus sp. 19428wA2_WM07]|nr:hypothetical protein [Streptococcus sp. 19428wA2_WM07]
TAIVVPVTPDRPVEPNKPVNPDTPDLPKNPDPTDPTTPNYPNPTDPAIQTLTENVKRTVRYVDESGKVIAEEVVDNLGFTRTGTINLAT